MKQSVRYLLLLIFIGTASICKASHIYATDFYYEYIGGNSYRVTMAVYGDCTPGNSFPSLTSSTPEVQLYDYNSLVASSWLTKESPEVEVTPVCPSEFNNTNCKGGTNPGVTRFIYSAVFNVPYQSANWQFHFTGNMGGNSAAGRSNLITNLVMPTNGSIMVLDITLNNMTGNNSSPRFTTLPTPFYCVNFPQQYNQGAVDPNGDSLVYALAPAQQTVGAAVYVNTFSPTDPLGLGTTNFNFNNATGQMNFTPTFTQNSTVVNKVYEYRNGVLVGSATREMTFVVRSNCSNNAPTGKPDINVISIGGGVLDSVTNIFTACEGTGQIHFKINGADLDADQVEMSATGLPAGATFNVSNNNSVSPSAVFTWNLAGVTAGTYNFYVTFKDNGCPLSSQQTQAYTIRIIRPATIIPEVIYPTECAHKAFVRLKLLDGSLPRNVVISQNGNQIRSFMDNTGIYTDSLDAGTYQFTVTSTNLPCNTNATFTVKDSGIYPYPPTVSNAYYCRNDAAVTMEATPVPGGSVFWYDSLGTRMGTPPIPNTAADGITTWYVSTQFKVCESRKVPVLAYVTKRPVADMLITPTTLCSKDTVTAIFTGSIGVGPILEYEWGWDGGVAYSGTGPGPWKVKWWSGGIKTVTLRVLENKCPSDSIAQDILVKPTPQVGFTTQNICLYDTMQIAYTEDTLSGQRYAWNFDGASPAFSSSMGPFNVHWTTPGVKHVFLEVSKDGCSDTLSKYPVVYDAPEAVILTRPETVCIGDKVYLQYTGKGTAQWTPARQVYRETDGRIYTNVIRPTTYTLTLTNEFECVDSASIIYNDIEPCCNFSYPNAFTPNNDGKNDVFRVVTYGNDQDFALSIYNRWGQRVYYSGNQKEGWDGKINGKEADAGTYFYVLRAKCLTGQEEFKKGDFTLIR